MFVVDPETYLRCCAEDVLAESRRGVFDDRQELAIRAETLRAVGVLDEAVVDRVLRAYGTAAALRGMERAWQGRPARRPRPPTALRWLRVPAKITLPTGTLRPASLAIQDGRVRLSGTMRFAPPKPAAAPSGAGPVPPYGRPHHFHHGPPSLTMADDQGGQVVAHFAGSGSANEAQGRWTADAPLAAGTEHLLIDGVRVDLVDVVPAAVTVEPVPDLGRVEHHLRQVLLRQAANVHGEGTERFECVLETLAAVGAIGPYDPAAESGRSASAALADAADGGAPSARELVALDEIWRSPLSRLHAQSRRRGTTTIAAQVVLDGSDMVIHSARVADGTVQLDFEADSARELPRQSPLRITIRAVDDAGNHYLSRLEGWETDQEDRISGQLALWPALDHAARELSLIFAGDTEQAIIRVDLPEAR